MVIVNNLHQVNRTNLHLVLGALKHLDAFLPHREQIDSNLALEDTWLFE
jgi:hypothetical protein